MKISILIAAYNVEKYIYRCINSCVEQTYKKIEIIIVNDGSNDKTLTVINKIIDKRIKIINKKNEGLVSARLTGINNATGDYVFFLDGDDYIPNNAIELLVNGLTYNQKIDIVVAKYQINFSNNNKKVVDYGFKQGNKFELLNSMYYNTLWNVWGNLYKLNLYEKIVFPINLTRSIGEDLVILTQLVFYSEKIIFVDAISYFYEKRDDSIIGSTKANNLWGEGYGAFVLTNDFLKTHRIEKQIRRGLVKLHVIYSLGYLRLNIKNEKYETQFKESLIYLLKNIKEVCKIFSLKIYALIVIANINTSLAKKIINLYMK